MDLDYVFDLQTRKKEPGLCPANLISRSVNNPRGLSSQAFEY